MSPALVLETVVLCGTMTPLYMHTQILVEKALQCRIQFLRVQALYEILTKVKVVVYAG